MKFSAQAVDDLVGVYFARTLVERLERNKHVADVSASASGSAASDECRDSLNGGVLKNHLGKLFLFDRHRREADVLCRARTAAEPASVLLREEALGNYHEEIDIEERTTDGDA